MACDVTQFYMMIRWKHARFKLCCVVSVLCCCLYWHISYFDPLSSSRVGVYLPLLNRLLFVLTAWRDSNIISVLIPLFLSKNPGRREEPVASEQHGVQRPELLQPDDQPVEPAGLAQHPQEPGRGGRGGRLHLRCRRLAGLHASQHGGEVRH